MPTFIDESGDPGFKSGSSNHFLLCAVTIHLASVADELPQAIRQLKVDLKMPAGREIKFSRTGSLPKHRAAFFDVALQFPWRFAAVAIEKRSIPHAAQTNAICYLSTSTAISVLLRPEYKARWEANPKGYRKESVAVDDNKDREYLRILAEQFRCLGSAESPAVTLVGEVYFRDGRSEVLLQLADMLSGAVYDSVGGNDTWLNRVKSRQLSTTWCLPGRV